MRRLDDQMRAAEQRVRDAVDAEWRHGEAESNPFLAALRDRLAEAEAKLERARKTGDADRIARAETEVAQRRSLLPDCDRRSAEPRRPDHRPQLTRCRPTRAKRASRRVRGRRSDG